MHANNNIDRSSGLVDYKNIGEGVGFLRLRFNRSLEQAALRDWRIIFILLTEISTYEMILYVHMRSSLGV